MIHRCTDIDNGDSIQTSNVTVSRYCTEHCHHHAHIHIVLNTVTTMHMYILYWTLSPPCTCTYCTEHCHHHAHVHIVLNTVTTMHMYILRPFYKHGILYIQFQTRTGKELSKYVMAEAHRAKDKNNQSTRSVQRLATGWAVQGSNPSGGEIFFRVHQIRLRVPPSLLYNRYRILPKGVKRPGRGADHPTASSHKVSNRLVLYHPLSSVSAQKCHGVNFNWWKKENLKFNGKSFSLTSPFSHCRFFPHAFCTFIFFPPKPFKNR
jgi:hypothetical protein